MVHDESMGTLINLWIDRAQSRGIRTRRFDREVREFSLGGSESYWTFRSFNWIR